MLVTFGGFIGIKSILLGSLKGFNVNNRMCNIRKNMK